MSIILFRKGQDSIKKKTLEEQVKDYVKKQKIETRNARKSDVVILDELRKHYSRGSTEKREDDSR